jgi:hypothetical protein
MLRAAATPGFCLRGIERGHLSVWCTCINDPGSYHGLGVSTGRHTRQSRAVV